MAWRFTVVSSAREPQNITDGPTTNHQHSHRHQSHNIAQLSLPSVVILKAFSDTMADRFPSIEDIDAGTVPRVPRSPCVY